MKYYQSAALAGMCALAACDESLAPAGPSLRMQVAPLTLEGVDEACYDLKVSNGSDTVWSKGNPLVTHLGLDQNGGTASPTAPDSQTICSGAYGSGAGGDITYVGTCDASVDAAPLVPGVQNSVTVWVDGLYADGADLGDWRDPCPTGCSLMTNCEENADNLVEVNLTIMRQAHQGFFDIAVNFDDIFCSAKVDCRYPGNGGPIESVIDPANGKRVQTVVWAFACTDGDPAGSDETTATHLYMDDLVLDCGGTLYTIPAAAGPGNIYPGEGTPPAPLVQAMEFEGRELIHNGLLDADKVFWNVALGLDAEFFATAPDCTLHTKATASKGPLAGGTTPENTNYPMVVVDVAINHGSAIVCTQHGLDGSAPHDGVATDYTGVAGGGVGFSSASFANEGTRPGGIFGTNPRCVASQHTTANDCGCPSAVCSNGTTCGGGTCGCGAGTTWNGSCCALPGFSCIAPGTFVMGSPDHAFENQYVMGGTTYDQTQHQVTLTRGFWMQQTEVTQGQWQAVWQAKRGPGSYNPSNFPLSPSHPVDTVSWFDAAAYLNALSEQQALTPCYDLSTCTGNPVGPAYQCSATNLGPSAGCNGYRFPTEAEWEYAGRAGTSGPFYNWNGVFADRFGLLNLIAWQCSNSECNDAYYTHPVGLLAPNSFGLFDVIGNVPEWVQDWMAAYPADQDYLPGPVTDPTGLATSNVRALRGGGFNNGSTSVTVSARGALPPALRGNQMGFRAARTMP